MERLTEEQIKEINEKCPYDQGVYKEPYGINTTIKEPVIYKRWVTGGMTGGSYHEDSCLRPREGDPEPPFTALDEVLKILKPDISLLEYRDIEKLILDDSYGEYIDYYGNGEDYEVKYIPLSKLYNYLGI